VGFCREADTTFRRGSACGVVVNGVNRRNEVEAGSLPDAVTDLRLRGLEDWTWYDRSPFLLSSCRCFGGRRSMFDFRVCPHSHRVHQRLSWRRSGCQHGPRGGCLPVTDTANIQRVYRHGESTTTSLCRRPRPLASFQFAGAVRSWRQLSFAKFHGLLFADGQGP
jgi:hypothetical protein